MEVSEVPSVKIPSVNRRILLIRLLGGIGGVSGKWGAFIGLCWIQKRQVARAGTFAPDNEPGARRAPRKMECMTLRGTGGAREARPGKFHMC